jgi:hypothetical protein
VFDAPAHLGQDDVDLRFAYHFTLDEQIPRPEQDIVGV